MHFFFTIVPSIMPWMSCLLVLGYLFRVSPILFLPFVMMGNLDSICRVISG